MKKRLLKKIIILSVVLAVTAGSFGSAVCAYGASDGPDIKGQAAIVYCASTNEVLWQKDEPCQHYKTHDVPHCHRKAGTE